MQAGSKHQDASVKEAWRITEDAWREVQRSPYVQSKLGTVMTRLPDVSFEEAQRRSSIGRSLLKRLEALDLSTIPHVLALTLRLAHFRARTWAREAEWYWTVLDPCGIGLFGLFLPTAYCGGYLLNFVHKQFAAFPFHEPCDADRYLALVADYGRLIAQFTARTAGQAERDILMPKVQVGHARALLTALRSGARAHLSVTPQRLAASWATELAREIEHCIVANVEPAFDRALGELSDAYLAKAPETVGVGQYPGGEKLYVQLVKLHTTLDLTPQQVHARGLERLSEIEESIRTVQTELGFGLDSTDFAVRVNNDAQWRANTIEDVAALFQRYMDRIEPRFNDCFSTIPQAPYGVAPLPEALQRSMTYGYYDPPKTEQGSGIYRFNAANLMTQPLFRIASLTYHELMPGHHLQFATQQENQDLHPFRANSFVNAYAEGWAEYAATLAGELGMYELPEERYGRLVMDAFLTSRLVVDTGMNVLGWSLEKACDYMRLHSRIPESEILTETLRYSCDIPAQALAYKLGDTQILAMRERMRQALGTGFNLKDFHDAILKPGALPLSDLNWHIDHEIDRLRALHAP